MNVLGDTIHAYLAVDKSNLPETEKISVAAEIIRNWGMENSLDPFEVVSAELKMWEFLHSKYPNCKVYREWPVSVKNTEGQIMQGWIDLLLENENGFVIIDHKDYPGQDPELRAQQYTPQLSAYKMAVERATGKPVLDLLIHMPVNGLFLKLE